MKLSRMSKHAALAAKVRSKRDRVQGLGGPYPYSLRRQARCWPASRAIIWPVIEGVARRKRMAAVTSSAPTGRCSKVERDSYSNAALPWVLLGNTGPGAMAFTLI